jgi:beta-N-acetylhexosaminidase
LSVNERRPRALVLGCAGPALDDDERAFFRDADPLGFILFQRNCVEPAQVRELIADLRASVGRQDAPVLIDQEGGRVARLKPPHWRAAPPPARLARLADGPGGLPAAIEAVKLNARLLAEELAALGIDVDCLPVLDLRYPGASDVVGDRSFGVDPARVTALGRACCEGLLAGGVLPVVKHVPGHGRGMVDSHVSTPIVETALAELERTDFAPFRELADLPLAMTGHVVYRQVDPERPATVSPRVIEQVIRGHIGFQGLLISDDLSMSALGGTLGERVAACLAAGCDVALHCDGVLSRMADAVANAGPMTDQALARWLRARAMLPRRDQVDLAALTRRLDVLLSGG